jgi:hypothetical protein
MGVGVDVDIMASTSFSAEHFAVASAFSFPRMPA